MSPSPVRRLALVTGASSGIGAAFARALAARGFDIVLVARRRERLEALAAELARNFDVEGLVVPADLSAPGAEAGVTAAVAAAGRSVHTLVNNAGFGIPRTFTGASWAEQRDFLMTLAVAPCALAHAFLPDMLTAADGAVINVASIAGFAPGVAGNTLYPGVKSLMIKFSQALDLECRGKGVRVTAVCPGATRTEFMATAGVAAGSHGGRLFTQTAEAVAAAALRANDRGRAVVVPGWHTRVAVGLMRILPEPLVRAAVNAGASGYLLED